MARLHSLDGLRGVAALVVVVHHCLLISPALADSYRGGQASGAVDVLLTRTPVHLLWDGTGAVLVFFVLSGYVLTLAVDHPGRDRWGAYYLRRLPRLYLPVWAALAFAVVLAELVPRVAVAGQSWWLAAHAQTVTPILVAGDASLLTNASLVDSPLWSLRWELWFSLLLPAYVWLAVHGRRLVAIQAVALLAVIGVGSWSGHASLLYLPVFGLGALLAAHRDRLAAYLSRLHRGMWLVVASAGVVMLSAGFAVGPFAEWIDRPLRSAGAVMVLLVFLGCRPVSRMARRPVLQWLGAVSFSLYLVHEPIVVTVASVLPGTPNAWFVLLLSLPLSLVAATVFHRYVERPSMRAGRGLARYDKTASAVWFEPEMAGARTVDADIRRPET